MANPVLSSAPAAIDSPTSSFDSLPAINASHPSSSGGTISFRSLLKKHTKLNLSKTKGSKNDSPISSPFGSSTSLSQAKVSIVEPALHDESHESGFLTGRKSSAPPSVSREIQKDPTPNRPHKPAPRLQEPESDTVGENSQPVADNQVSPSDSSAPQPQHRKPKPLPRINRPPPSIPHKRPTAYSTLPTPKSLSKLASGASTPPLDPIHPAHPPTLELDFKAYTVESPRKASSPMSQRSLLSRRHHSELDLRSEITHKSGRHLSDKPIRRDKIARPKGIILPPDSFADPQEEPTTKGALDDNISSNVDEVHVGTTKLVFPHLDNPFAEELDLEPVHTEESPTSSSTATDTLNNQLPALSPRKKPPKPREPKPAGPPSGAADAPALPLLSQARKRRNNRPRSRSMPPVRAPGAFERSVTLATYGPHDGDVHDDQ